MITQLGPDVYSLRHQHDRQDSSKPHRSPFRGGVFILKIVFLRERDEADWIVEDPFDPLTIESK